MWRLWLVFAVLWIGIGTALAIVTFDPPSKLFYYMPVDDTLRGFVACYDQVQDRKELCEGLREKLDASDAVIAHLPEGFEIRFAARGDASADGALIWPVDFEHHSMSWSAIKQPGGKVRVRLDELKQRATEQYQRARHSAYVDRVEVFGLAVLLPPLALLMVEAAVGWALGGFRSKSDSGKRE